MYAHPDSIPAPLTMLEILAGLRRLELDAGDAAFKASGPFAAQKRAEAKILRDAAALIRELGAQ
jgi:hypothetical protein